MYKISLIDKYLNLKINTSKNQKYNKKRLCRMLFTQSPKVYFYSYGSNSYYLSTLDRHKNIFRNKIHFKIDFRLN